MSLKHEKEYIIRTYEGDKNSNLRLVALFNIFQDIADEHAEELGFGLTFCLNRKFAWVGSRYHIKINRFPKIHEKIKITTWPADEQKFGAIRDFSVTDKFDNEIIVGSSLWILIDVARRRPLLIRDNLPEWTPHKERALNTEFPKISEVSGEVESIPFKIRYDDIDINNHVNNAIYPLWASESVDIDFHNEHTIEELEIEFKKEGFLGEQIVVQTKMDNNISTHSIKCEEDGRELSRVKIAWK